MQNNRHEQLCVLQAGGYRVAFALRPAPLSSEHFDGTIEMVGAPELGIPSVKSKPMFLSRHDLVRLAAYLENHIASLQEDPSSEAPVFVPLELGFEIQALAGDVFSAEEGEFTLRFMVQVGEPGADTGRIYFGASSTVDVTDIRRFLESIQSLELRPTASS